MTAAEHPTTQLKITLAAMDLFARNGYERTAIGDIARASGVGTGSIYYFFPSKSDIVCAVLELYLDQLHQVVMAPAFGRTKDPIKRVFEVLADYRARLVDSNFKYRCPIGSLALEIGSELPAARELIERNFAQWRAAIQRCFEDARPRLRRGVDTKALAGLVLTVMEGGLMQCAAEQSIAPFDASVKQLHIWITSLTEKGTS